MRRPPVSNATFINELKNGPGRSGKGEHRSRCLPEGLGSSGEVFSLVGQCCRDCVFPGGAKEVAWMRRFRCRNRNERLPVQPEFLSGRRRKAWEQPWKSILPCGEW